MKTPEDWIKHFRGDCGWTAALLDANEISQIQADALAHAVLIAENHVEQIYRVDSKEAEAIRYLNCKIRSFSSKYALRAAINPSQDS